MDCQIEFDSEANIFEIINSVEDECNYDDDQVMVGVVLKEQDSFLIY